MSLQIYRENVTSGGQPQLLGAPTVTGTNWSFQETQSLLADTQYRYTVKITDGTTSIASNTYTINTTNVGTFYESTPSVTPSATHFPCSY